MDLKDLPRVEKLEEELRQADEKLRAFETMPGTTVPTRAVAGHANSAGRAIWVELLPVDKSVAVSAARREREKIVDQLRQLGVTVC